MNVPSKSTKLCLMAEHNVRMCAMVAIMIRGPLHMNSCDVQFYAPNGTTHPTSNSYDYKHSICANMPKVHAYLMTSAITLTHSASAVEPSYITNPYTSINLS